MSNAGVSHLQQHTLTQTISHSPPSRPQSKVKLDTGVALAQAYTARTVSEPPQSVRGVERVRQSHRERERQRQTEMEMEKRKDRQTDRHIRLCPLASPLPSLILFHSPSSLHLLAPVAFLSLLPPFFLDLPLASSSLQLTPWPPVLQCRVKECAK